MSDRQKITALFLFGLLLCANSVFNSIMSGLGYGWPYSSFLFSPTDLFGDLYKVALSYPGPPIPEVVWRDWSEQLVSYATSNPYQGVGGLSLPGALTHLHNTPAATVAAVTVRYFLAFTSPLSIFIFANAMWMVPLGVILTRLSRDGASPVGLYLLILVSYPILVLITRGNFYSGIVMVSFIIFFIELFRRRVTWLGAIVFALCVSLRPNAIILLAFVPVMLTLVATVKTVAKIVFAAAVLNGLAMMSLGWLYADYSLAGFVQALSRYRELYLFGDAGLAYGSSLVGALKFSYYLLTGLKLGAAAIQFLEFTAIGAGGIVCLLVIALVRARRLATLDSLFIIASVYVLVSAVIGDYHLSVFLLPIVYCLFFPESMSTARHDQPVDMEKVFGLARLPVAMVVSIILISPKNYVFIDGVSLQVILNPAAMLLGISVLFYRALSGRR